MGDRSWGRRGSGEERNLPEAPSNPGRRSAPQKPGLSANYFPGLPQFWAIGCSWKCAGMETAPPRKMCI